MQCAYSKNFPMCNACVLKIPRELVQRKGSLSKIFYIQNVPLENSNAYFTFSRSLQSNVCFQKFINMHMHSQKKISMQCRYSKNSQHNTHTYKKFYVHNACSTKFYTCNAHTQKFSTYGPYSQNFVGETCTQKFSACNAKSQKFSTCNAMYVFKKNFLVCIEYSKKFLTCKACSQKVFMHDAVFKRFLAHNIYCEICELAQNIFYA